MTFLYVILLQLLFNNVHLKAAFEFVESILHVTSTIDQLLIYLLHAIFG